MSDYQDQQLVFEPGENLGANGEIVLSGIRGEKDRRPAAEGKSDGDTRASTE